MLEAARRVEEVAVADAADLPLAEILGQGRPMVFKGLARGFGLVQAGLEGPEAAMAYLARFDAGRPVVLYLGPPQIGGRFFYDEDLSGLNFQGGRAPLAEVFERLRAQLADPAPPAVYVGSTDVDGFFPGFRAENDLAFAAGALGPQPPLVSLWLGGRTTAAAHWDMSNNAACNLVGRRRFTLFPPEQVANLYPGPLEPTPGGQVVSLVDFRAPDLARFPRFAEAVRHAQVAELEPGDELVYPALWWHQVEALEPFNAMMNYWWNDTPAFMDSPMNTLLHGLLSLRGRPAHEKAGWRAMFDHYLFAPAERAVEAIPPAAQGALGPLDETAARRLRAQLLNRLNR